MGSDTPTSGGWPSHMTSDAPPQRWDQIHSRQSSISSQSSGASASSAQHAVESSVLTKQSPTVEFTQPLYPRPEPSYPVDPLAREYPKPTEELDVWEALNRKPGRWTLGHYIKETPVRSPPRTREMNSKNVAQDMEAKKQELLKVRDDIRALSLRK